MTPYKSTIDTLFNGKNVYKIPFYQRSYVWGDEQLSRFLNDMISVGQQDKAYFLGSIILKQIATGTAAFSTPRIVIDGQQRLTTIAIFLKVLYLKSNANAWFERMFILPDNSFSLIHSLVDKGDFERVMLLEECKGPIEGKGSIIHAYNYFFENLDITAINYDSIKDKVQLIDIEIDAQDNEQQIFDTINSLGVDLTTAELLKNHIFDENSVSEYQKHWIPIFEKDDDTIAFWAADLLKGRIKQRNVEAFLSAYLQIKVNEPGKGISAQDKLQYSKGTALFYNYKRFIATYYDGHKLDFVIDLAQYAKIFHSVFTPDVAEHTLSSESGIDRVNFLIYVIGNTTLMPYVMYVEKNQKDEDEKKRIYDYLESYVVRRLICSKSPKNYSDLFSEALIGANIITRDALCNYINEKDRTNALAMPMNKELLASVLDTEHPNNRGLAILYLLESRMRNGRMLSTQLLKYSSYTLEHLMPQKWQANWPLPAGVESAERIHKIRTLGNFTLITQSLNSAIGNEEWRVKLIGKNGKQGLLTFAKDLLTLSNTLELNSWDEQTIEARSTWLAYHASLQWASLIPTDVRLEEPQLEDGVLVGDIMNDEAPEAKKRDKTRYSLDGGKAYFSKSLFVHEFIAQYIKKHKKITYQELRTIFNDKLLEPRHRVRGLLIRKSDYDEWQRPDKKQRYGVGRPDALLTSSDGVPFYVNTQWTLDSVQNIIAIAKEDGFEVMIKL